MISRALIGPQRAGGLRSHRRPDRGRPSPYMAGGPPSHCVYKQRWGPAAHTTRFTVCRRHPTDTNPSRSRGCAVAAGRSHRRRRHVVTARRRARPRPKPVATRRPPGLAPLHHAVTDSSGSDGFRLRQHSGRPRRYVPTLLLLSLSITQS